jgi:hypothetical protein
MTDQDRRPERTDPTAATAGEHRNEGQSAAGPAGVGYGGQGGGDSGNALTGTAQGIAGGTTGSAIGAWQYGEGGEAQDATPAAGGPAPVDPTAVEAGAETPAKE